MEDNRGYSGRALEAGQTYCGLDIAKLSLVPTKTASHLFLYIALGLNDIGITNGTFTPAGYQTTLTAMVDNAISKGWPLGSIVLVTPFWIPTNGFTSYFSYSGTTLLPDIARQEAYAKAARTVAAQKNTVLADIYTAIRDNPNRTAFLQADELHYNK